MLCSYQILLMHLCMIIHDILREAFVSINYTLLAQKKYQYVIFNYCFKINDKQLIKMSKNNEYGRFKNYENKIKSPFIIYADLESNLVPEDNRKKNPEEC